MEKWIELYRVGNFIHNTYGKFQVTPKILAEMKANFDNGVHGRFMDKQPVVDLDYNHKQGKEGDKAAGWIKELMIKDNVLMGKVTYTPEGEKAVEHGEYLYHSPEVHDEYIDPDSGKKFFNVLMGAALTNRPFVRRMNPARVFSDYIPIKEDKMRELIIKMLTDAGIKFEADAKDEALVSLLEAHVKKLSDDSTAKDAQIKKLSETETKGKASDEALVKRLTDVENELAIFKKKELMEKAKKKIAPAGLAEKGWYKLLADKDPILAEKMLAEMPDIVTEPKGSEGGDADEKSVKMLAEEKVTKAKKLVADKVCKTIDEAFDKIEKEAK